jgi:hypothetical protein
MMRIHAPALGRRLAAFATAVSLIVSPIATTSAYAAKPKKLVDTCLASRKPFTQIKNYQLNKIIGGTVKGALGGAALGFLTDMVAPEYERDQQGNVLVDSNGKPRKKSTVLQKAVIGAAAGGLIGWFSSLKQTARNQEELQAAVNSNFRQDVDQFSPLGQSLADLGNCRRAQIFAVQQSFERGEIDAKTAAKQLDQLDEWIAKDDEIISKAAKMQSNTVGAYARATAMADGQDPGTVDKNENQVLSTMEAQSTAYKPTITESYVTGDGGEINTPPPPPQTQTRYVRALQSKGVSLRAEALPNAAAVVFLPNGTEVETEPSNTEGWLSVTAGEAKGYMKESLLADEPPATRKQAPVKPKAKPAPVVTKPPPGKAATRLAYVPPSRQPVKARDNASLAVASNAGFAQLKARNSQATSDQMRAARRALES